MPVRNTARLLSAAGTTNATLVSATGVTIKRITGFNARASAVYLKLYDKATAPTVGTDTPRKTLYIPASLAFSFEMDDFFGTGLGYGMTTAGADNSTAALTAADILALNIDYD